MGLRKGSEVMPARQPDGSRGLCPQVLPLRCRSSSKAFHTTRKVRDMLGKWLADHPHCNMERDGDAEEESPSACWTTEEKCQQSLMASCDQQGERKLPENSGRALGLAAVCDGPVVTKWHLGTPCPR